MRACQGGRPEENKKHVPSWTKRQRLYDLVLYTGTTYPVPLWYKAAQMC